MKAIEMGNGEKSFGWYCSTCGIVHKGINAKEEADCCCTDKGVCDVCKKITKLQKNPFDDEEGSLEIEGVKGFNVCSECNEKNQKFVIKFYEEGYLAKGKMKGDKIFLYDDFAEGDSGKEFPSIDKLLRFAFSKQNFNPEIRILRYGKNKKVGSEVDTFLSSLFPGEEFQKERKEIKKVILAWYKSLPKHVLEFIDPDVESDW